MAALQSGTSGLASLKLEWRIIMQHKRNQFFNFFISCVPGAGQMYQGFLKRGTSLMTIFFVEIFLAGIVNIDWILLGLPVIWSYSFFDSMNTNSLSDEEFSKIEDRYLFTNENTTFKIPQNKIRIPAAILLIFMGGYILLENIAYVLRNILGYSYNWRFIELIFDYFPRFLFAAIVIAAGVYLIKGKKVQMDEDDIYNPGNDGM